MADVPPPPSRRGILAVLLGTGPGLERFLLASVPAIVIGSLAGYAFGAWAGFATGFAVLAAGIALSKKISD